MMTYEDGKGKIKLIDILNYNTDFVDKDTFLADRYDMKEVLSAKTINELMFALEKVDVYCKVICDVKEKLLIVSVNKKYYLDYSLDCEEFILINK